jgi:peptide chain release factor subunit 1
MGTGAGMSVVAAARRLVEHRSTHPVVSLYLDLDPERFATAPARASQIRSLLDQAARDVEQDDTLGHEDRIGLREDLDRVRRYLLSREPPFKGARSLAMFCSGRDGLFEVIRISRPLEGRVVIERTPFIEPLVLSVQARRWCVTLVNRRDGRIFTGPPDQLHERERIEESIHGQHDQGGWSQANYQRSVDQDVESHLRHVAEVLHRAWYRSRFDRLAIGGPQELVPRFEAALHEDLRTRLVERRVEVDIGAATDDQIRGAVKALVDDEERKRERSALDRLSAGLATGGRAAAGLEATLDALNERRVEKLLLENGIDRRGGRCPGCGLLTVETHGACPADGSELEEVEHLREAAIEAALVQDAEVIVIRRYPDLGPYRGMAALLRF